MDLFYGGKQDRSIMAVDALRRRDQHLKRFIENIPNIIEMEELYVHRRVFWSEDEITKSSSPSVHRWVGYSKIKSAFANVNAFPVKEIIFQFWAPYMSKTGDMLLHTMAQPVALTPVNPNLRKYRSASSHLRIGRPTLITPQTSAFQKGFPEVVLDLNLHEGKGRHPSSLVDVALSCGLTCCLSLPIFDPYSQPIFDPSSQTSCNTTCAGIVECCIKGSKDLLVLFNQLKRELQRVGLQIYHVQGSWPYKTISGGLKPASNEIEKALEMVCELHDLTLGQVWITYDESEGESHHVPSSSDTQTKQMFLVKLFGYCVDSHDDPLSPVKDFYDKCDVLPLNMGEGLAGMTLKTYEPHLCRNIHNSQTDNTGVLAVLYANIECSRLMICLRSTHTGDDVDYVFEFFWPQTRNYLILLESMLSTLKRCLPSFKFASGAQLDDELRVVDVSQSGIDSFKIFKFKGNNLLQTTKELNNEKRGVKRTFSDMKQEPLTDDINKKTYGEEDDDFEDIPILVLYCKTATLIFLPSSSCTLANLKGKIKQHFRWDPAVDFSLEFEAASKGELYGVHNDASLRDCFLYRKRESDKSYIKVCVK